MTDTAKKLNETQYPASSPAPRRDWNINLQSGRGYLMRGKKQGGLQQVFVKFSFGLKGQQGPFFAKQERRENKACVWKSCKVFLLVNFSETNRKEPQC